MISRLRLICLVLMSCALTCVCTELARAQLNSGATISVFPPAPRSLRQNLVRAKKAIEEGRYSDAVAEIGVVLTGQNSDLTSADESQDFFIEVSGQPGVQTSVKTEAQRLLGTLPPKGRELFELQFGSDARALFDSAVQKADINQLNEVVRQYFHTKAGYEATLLLGRLHLDHGRPLAAALCLQRVAQVPHAAKQFEPELSLLLAACWQLAHQPAQAQATLATLPPRLPRGQIRLGDSEVNELPTPQQAVAWLTEHFRAAALDETEAGQWPLFRGNPSRNATRNGGIPLKRSRWQVPLVKDAHDRALIEDLRGGFIEQGSPMLPVVQPLAVGNVILLRSSEKLLGIDFESGKRVWEFPWDLAEGDDDDEQQQQSNLNLPRQNMGDSRDLQLTLLRERLWHDVPYGQVSSDGNSVYLLDGLRQVPQQMNPRMRWNRGRLGGFPMEPSALQNELVALDLEREGYLLWKVGGETGGQEPKLAEVFFLGPPLPLFGNLYLIAQIKGELRLVVLDAATGKQQWTQQLAHMEAILGMDEHIRRYSGATPSFADGVLVCPTSAGAVVAVDVATRTLLWGYQYSSNNSREIFRPGLMQPLPLQTAISVNRWQDSAVTIADGNVVISPAESDLLVCLDLLTGKPRWQPMPRQGELADMLYVAGIHDGAAILVGKNRLTAIGLQDGKLAWKEPAKLQPTENEMPSGRGFLSDHFYYLPTTKSQLVKIDLRDGQIVERTDTDHALGNVICFRDEIISVAADRASTFYQIEPLRKKVDSRLRDAPDDAWALARRGELLVHEGKTVEALEVLRKARQRDQRDEGVRELLVDTYLAALGEDFSKHSALASEIEPLIDNDSQRAKYLTLVATGYQRIGNQPLAVDYFAKLAIQSAANAKKIPTSEAFALISPSKDWTIRTDRFVSSQLQEFYKTDDPAVRERIDSLVRELINRTDAKSAADVRRLFQLCGFHPATNEHRLQFASKLIDGGEFLEAEFVLNPLLDGNDSQLTGRAIALTAKLYELARQPKLAAEAYARLNKDWNGVEVSGGKTGRQLFDEAVSKKPASTSADSTWPAGLVTVNETHEVARNMMYPAQQPGYSILQRRGSGLENLKLVLDASRTVAYLRDGNGSSVFKLPSVPIDNRLRSEAGLWQIAADGHLLFSYFGGHLAAVNTLHTRPNELESLLWHETILTGDQDSIQVLTKELQNPFDSNPLVINRFRDPQSRPLATIGPMTSQGVCFQKIRALVCVDAWTGNPIWTRNDFDQGCELFGDHEFIFVQPPSSAGTNASDAVECWLLNAADGRTIGKRKLPPSINRWTTRGRNVLGWEPQPDKHASRLFLYDAERQADIWSESFPDGSRGCLIENDAVAVLRPDGRFVVRSLTGATPMTETQIEPIATIASIRIASSADQYLLIINESEAATDGDSWRRRNSVPVDGRILALDRATGESLWQVPATIRGFGMLPDQPSELPTLWFVRYHLGSNNQFGGTSNSKVDVLCLDRRTGSRLFLNTNVPTNLNSSEILPDLRKKEVTLALPQAQFTVRFSTEPTPPAPPYQQPSDIKEPAKGAAAAAPSAKDDPFK